MKCKADNAVPLWLWRTAVGSLALVVLVGLIGAWWLGTRPSVTGTPIPLSELGTWTFSPGATGNETDGRLSLRAGEVNRPVYATRALVLSDFALQARVRLTSGPDDAGYGLIVRRLSPDDFVTLFIGTDGYIAIGQMSSGAWRWRVPWQQWPHIKRGAADNLLRAECHADRCRFFVNDEFAFEVNDVPAQGQAGAAVWNPSQDVNISATFRDWQVWR